MGSNEKKTAFLGMPWGTASGKLYRKILWNFVQRNNEDICFRCKEKIETMEEFSIEHKLPWFGISVELFWDLDNIAFSHKSCNMPHRKPGGGLAKRKVGPPGTAWCIGCKEFHPIAEFHSNVARWNKLQNHCKRFTTNNFENNKES